MAKLFLCNSRITELVKHKNVKAGFKNYNEIHLNNISLIAFNKLNVENENFYKFDNNDFVATAGTMIYREEIGAKALKSLYNDFSGEIYNIRKQIIGNYLLVIKKDGNIIIFCDENNIFNLFYYRDSINWFISNSLFDIANIASKNLTINEFNLIEYTFQSSIIGNGTIFNEITRLMGDEYIEINLSEKSFNIRKVLSEKVSIYSYDEDSLVEKFTKTLNEKVKVISNVFDKITICMTGGLDSRTILSTMLCNNIKPDLLYGVGNSPLTNTKDGDLEIVNIFADRYDLNLHVMNWKTPDKVDEYWHKYMEKYGFLSRIYNASNNIFTEFENNIDTEFVEFGYFGETLRNRPWLETISEDNFTLEKFIDDFYINRELTYMYSRYEKYKINLKNKFQDILKKHEIDEKRISKDNFSILYNNWFTGGAHTEKCNFVNYLFYSISIMGTYDINRIAVNTCYEYKKDAKFILKSLYALYPDILKVPFYSHGVDHIFNEKEFRLIRENRNNKIISNIKQKIKSKIKNEKLLDYLKSINILMQKKYYNKKSLDEMEKAKDLKKMLLKIIKNSDYNIIERPEKFQGYLPYLAWYSQLLFIIKKILKS